MNYGGSYYQGPFDGNYRHATEAECQEANEWCLHGQVNLPDSVTVTVTSEVALPEDVHILPRQRIGDAERLRAVEHLDHAFSKGLLDADEHHARSRYAMEGAQAQPDLHAIVSDLPPLPRTPRLKAPSQQARTAFHGWATAGLTAMIGFWSMVATFSPTANEMWRIAFIIIAAASALLLVHAVRGRK